MTFGQRLKEARLKTKLTQQQLGDLVGMKKASISSLETGASKKSASDNLLPLSKAVNVNPDWLITGKGDKHQLSPTQARIHEAMKYRGMKVLDLMEACNGRVALETIDLWLCGAVEPTSEQMDLITQPLGLGGIAAHESKGIGLIYDVRGEPVPENLSQIEIDVVRFMRDMGRDRRDCLHAIARDSAHAALDEADAMIKTKRA